MNRRIFIRSSVAFSTLATVGLFPWSVKGYSRDRNRERERERNIFTDPSAIEPVTGALPLFYPAVSDSLTPGAWQLKYDLIRWHEIRDDGLPLNINDGRLHIERKGNSDSGIYQISRQISLPSFISVNYKQACFSKVGIKTRGDYESISKWQITTFHNEPGRDAPEQQDSRITIQGEYDGQMIRLSTKKVLLSARKVTGPLLALYVIPELLLRNTLSRSAPFRFTLLEDGMRLRPYQELVYEGEAEIETAGGSINCDLWLQTGTGMLPIHWVSDAQGCPQIMTHSAVNWMLRDAING